ncbi:unnamed protein product, partial [Ectocarpus fasciculatus]
GLPCLLLGTLLPSQEHLDCDRTRLVAMATTAGGSKCLDAFILALNQACDGQWKRWYVSTLELQLVSLELCRACRSAQLLEVRIGEATPPTLWPSRISCATPRKRSREVCCSSRVPAVQAFGWECYLPTDRLPQRAAVELQPGPERRRQHGHSCAAGIGSVVWPQNLKRLFCYVDMPVNTVSWPTSVKELLFGDVFNQPIVDVGWPAFLQQLWFGHQFNQPIADVVWPDSLKELSFGRAFNQPIADVVWPPSLEQLSFGQCFNQPVVGVVWPASLQRLSFGFAFNQPI